MAAVEKFLFGRDFMAEAEAPAETAPSADQAAPAEPEPEPEPTYAEADLEAARAEARAQGHAEGLAEGRRQAEAEAETALTQATDRLAEAVGQLAEGAAARADRRDREQLQVAVELVQRLFPAFTRKHGLDEIEAVIRDGLERLRDEPRVVVRVCDRLLDPLKERVDRLAHKAGYEGRIVLLVDEEVADGDVRVEWADGGAERDSTRLWRDVDAALNRLGTRADPDRTAGGRAAAPRPDVREIHTPAEPAETPAEPAEPGETPAGSERRTDTPADTPAQPERSTETPAEPAAQARRSA